MKKRFSAHQCLLIAVLFGCASIANSSDQEVVTPDPLAVAVATQWLAWMDGGNYEVAYRNVAARVRAGGPLSEKQWIAQMEARRAPLGPPTSRTLVRARFSRTMARGPDGNYEFLDYETSFQYKEHGGETVILTKESGQWQVSGYEFK
jgi:hypothetical protein